MTIAGYQYNGKLKIKKVSGKANIASFYYQQEALEPIFEDEIPALFKAVLKRDCRQVINAIPIMFCQLHVFNYVRNACSFQRNSCSQNALKCSNKKFYPWVSFCMPLYEIYLFDLYKKFHVEVYIWYRCRIPNLLFIL